MLRLSPRPLADRDCVTVAIREKHEYKYVNLKIPKSKRLIVIVITNRRKPQFVLIAIDYRYYDIYSTEEIQRDRSVPGATR